MTLNIENYFTNNHIYWVGSRISDIESIKDSFYGSICAYGKTEGNHIALCDMFGIRYDNNAPSLEMNERVKDLMLDVAKKDPDALFMFYNPEWKYDIGGLDSISDRLICVNNKDLYDFYNSKIKTREKLKELSSNIINSKLVKKEDLNYSYFDSLFEEKSKYGYIVQSEYSSGGFGTTIINEKNKDLLLDKELLKDEQYLVSIYYKESIPVNYHAVIYNDNVLLFPGSVQILRNENDRLIYKGADYKAYQYLEPSINERAKIAIRDVCNCLREEGYRGICGIDAIITINGEIEIVEINTRFQGSSSILNIGLIDNGYKTLQEYCIESFIKDKSDIEDIEVNINYSCYSYANIFPYEHSDYILEKAKKEKNVYRIDMDGYEPNSVVGDNIHKFRICYKTNICAMNHDGEVWIHENICEPDKTIYHKVVEGDELALKITLLTQGIILEPNTEKYLKENGGIRNGNNNAFDIYLKGMVINTPCDVDYISLTPFSIIKEGEELSLYYYEKRIDTIKMYKFDKLAGKFTKSGRAYADIAFLSTDRLRVHMTNRCIYKKQNKGCQFCNIDVPEGTVIPLEDIREVVADYVENAPDLVHFLVGGQSAEEYSEKTRIVDIIKIIRELAPTKKIYSMVLPFGENTLQEMKDVGMDELACNVEIFNDELAKKYMPGKGAIPRNRYIEVLKYASNILYPNNKNAIRSMVIVGLESRNSTLEGLEELLKNNIQPIVSVFRPLPKTKLDYLTMPPAKYLYEFYIEAESICSKYGTHLGPDCIDCQNNTLSLPERYIGKYIAK